MPCSKIRCETSGLIFIFVHSAGFEPILHIPGREPLLNVEKPTNHILHSRVSFFKMCFFLTTSCIIYIRRFKMLIAEFFP